jgi:hypothetical protein
MIEKPSFGMVVLYTDEYRHSARMENPCTCLHHVDMMGSIAEVLEEPGVVEVLWANGLRTHTSVDILRGINQTSYACRHE